MVMISNLISFVVGVLLVQLLPELLPLSWVNLGVMAVLLYVVRCNGALVFFILGLLWAVLIATERLDNRLPQDLQGIDISVEGQIIGLPQQDDRKVRFDFRGVSSKRAERVLLPKKIRLSWYFPDQNIAAGQRWRLTVRLKRPHGNLNPGGFDYERWLFSQNIGATGYVRKKPEPVLLGGQTSGLNMSVWRQRVADDLNEFLQYSRYRGVIRALTMGDRQAISSGQWQIFRNSGTGHLMAISGLHIGLIAGLVYFIVVKFWAWTGVMTWSPPRVAAIFSLLAALVYSALSGFSISTQRALIMLAVAMLGVLLQRNVRPYHTLTIALFTVCVFDPTAVLAAGFWLSFLAVAMIIFALSGRTGKTVYWLSLLKIQWVVALGLTPLLIFLFQQVSVIAPIANLIAVPLVSFAIVPLALLALMLMYVWSAAATMLFAALDWIIGELMGGLSFLSDLPYATLNRPESSIGALLLALVGSFMLLLPKGIPGRWLGVVLLLPLLFVNKSALNPGEVRMTLLDVGQGLSAVIQTQKHTLVFDTGAKLSSQFDMGNRVLLPFLRSQAIHRVDKLIISHGDNDHVGGAESLLQGITVNQVYSSLPGLLRQYAPVLCRSGQSWQWDRVTFMMLAPGNPVQKGENNQSCVLKIISAHGSLLLPGDIENESETWLVNEYGRQLQAEVLVAPHHGSKTSSTVTFLNEVRPRFILIPAGYRNKFGFPHVQVLKNYRKISAQWWNTATAGALTVRVDSQGIMVTSYRDTHAKYWRH